MDFRSGPSSTSHVPPAHAASLCSSWRCGSRTTPTSAVGALPEATTLHGRHGRPARWGNTVSHPRHRADRSKLQNALPPYRSPPVRRVRRRGQETSARRLSAPRRSARDTQGAALSPSARSTNIYVYDLAPWVLSTTEYYGTGVHDGAEEQDAWDSLLRRRRLKLPDTVVSLASYPLAPASPTPVTFSLLVKLYHTLMREAGELVTLAGDSVGGNIALALALALHCLHELGASGNDTVALALRSLMVISPSTDLARRNPPIAEREKRDPLLNVAFVKASADAWAASWSLSDPRVSPLEAEVGVLVKYGVRVHGVTGSYDILAPDVILFREKCRAMGVEGEWLDWDKQMHCSVLPWIYPGRRESKEAKEWVSDVLRREG
ncbi:hypothetical protein B0A49_01106 [Cryomyces minteri]|uniref:Alpha/beta hydrolase fold-3 domain-containing protein n=1 Tax=Cryomyces minteri TaxID=331657 RepID=A0A4U0XQV4_9PEZI|nr:hypothetical protein B0A49_01106 [Cryomyces minteri]